MKTKLFYLFILFIIANNAKGKCNCLFDNTLNLICNYSTNNGEYIHISDSIATNVYNIVYDNIDELCPISIEDKLDLLHLMIIYQEYATRDYRNKIFHAFLKNDSIILAHPLFIAPFIFCHYCENTEITKHFKKTYSNTNFKYCTKVYSNYFEKLLNKIFQIDVLNNENPRLSQMHKYFYFTLTLQKELLTKYPDFIYLD